MFYILEPQSITQQWSLCVIHFIITVFDFSYSFFYLFLYKKALNYILIVSAKNYETAS